MSPALDSRLLALDSWTQPHMWCRDLKPENFLLSDKAENAPLKATDFGLSVFYKPGQVFTDVVGSAYYVAPEVVLPQPGAHLCSSGSHHDTQRVRPSDVDGYGAPAPLLWGM